MENMFERMANQDPIRDRLMVIMRKHPRSVNQVAKSMDISPITLAKFLRGKATVAWVSLCKIEDYIIAKESESKKREQEIAASILKGISQ
jgi:hypothetical protein